jgi:pimeloyl-ACP methyl ester carboxylesterase
MSYLDRAGSDGTAVYIHGLGCGSEDFRAMTQQSALRSYRLVAVDLPGCGDTVYEADDRLDIDGLVAVFGAFVTTLGLDRFLLVGGSMGGLIGLLYAERNLARLTGFANVEGNLSSEDCLFSRKVVGHDFAYFERVVFPSIKSQLSLAGNRGFAKHLEVLSRADPRAYYDYCAQLVEYSDHGELLRRFVQLPLRKHFIYGAQNRHLSYLARLRESSCAMFEIEHANHFPFYDDPAAFADAVRRCF